MGCSHCHGLLIVALPFNDGDLGGVDEYPCPRCVPWHNGFGGLTGRSDAGDTVLIPAVNPDTQPNERGNP